MQLGSWVALLLLHAAVGPVAKLDHYCGALQADSAGLGQQLGFVPAANLGSAVLKNFDHSKWLFALLLLLTPANLFVPEKSKKPVY